jgi:hypothetical protein
MTLRRMVLFGAAVAAAVLFVIEYPEIHRYIKMETM